VSLDFLFLKGILQELLKLKFLNAAQRCMRIHGSEETNHII